MSKNKKVFVGMSGGVDSSVTAALLVEQGYDVTGVYMKNWTQDLPGMVCPWREDYQDALKVAVHLGIDLKIFDFQKEYRAKVVDYMIAEYKAGRTPNPDIMCNQEVKFKLFLETAIEQGADLISTGHYARVGAPTRDLESLGRSMGEHAQPKALASPDDSRSRAGLFVAKNKEKDQTYFLYRVTEEALSRTLMPIGEFKTKAEVRALAKKFGLPTADKKDSQGICFVGKVGIKEFLSQYVKTKPGTIIDQNGKEIGEHEGAIYYTIGQRHGLDVGGGLPYYVTGKNMAKNEVYVTRKLDDEKLWSKELTITDLHWINEAPKDNMTYQVRTRYRAPLINCTFQGATLETGNKQLKLTLEDEVRAITPGQSAVIYDGDRVLGGGIVI